MAKNLRRSWPPYDKEERALCVPRDATGNKRLKQQVPQWFAQADALDTQEEHQHGGERCDDELPDWVADKQRRIA